VTIEPPKNVAAAAYDAAYYESLKNAELCVGNPDVMDVDHDVIEFAREEAALGLLTYFGAGAEDGCARIPIDTEAFAREMDMLEAYLKEKGLTKVSIALDLDRPAEGTLVARAIEAYLKNQ
jgi:hypothetical protein